MRRDFKICVGEVEFTVKLNIRGREVDIKIEKPAMLRRDVDVWILLLVGISEEMGIQTVEIINATESVAMGEYFQFKLEYRYRDAAEKYSLEIKHTRPTPTKLKIIFTHEPTELEVAIAAYKVSAMLVIYQNRKIIF